MLFNTFLFALFFVAVFAGHWWLCKGKVGNQNKWLCVASYIFYACWDWRFLFLLIFSTALDFFSGYKIYNSKSSTQKKYWLFLSVVINLGFLGVFKYYNFFAAQLIELFQVFGLTITLNSLQIILPVGISFYTFHGLSYVIDIYKNKIIPEKNFITYSLFVSFFPLLVAGPIERATHLLPQLTIARKFNYGLAMDGLRQILWGLFAKLVIADTCANYANYAFGENPINGSTAFLGAVFFAFQIYGDFAGYSNIALGTAKLLGVELLQNFSFPYFSRNIAEFWKRWHISLSSWFRDYVYIPLGGNAKGKWITIRNVCIVFLLSGFWHGANFTFIAWGLLHALLFVPLLVINRHKQFTQIVAANSYFPSIKEGLQMLLTFVLATLAWVFFRAENLQQAFSYINTIFSKSFFSLPFFGVDNKLLLVGALLVLFISIEWLGRKSTYALQTLFLNKPLWLRITSYYALTLFILAFSNKATKVFIYFQF